MPSQTRPISLLYRFPTARVPPLQSVNRRDFLVRGGLTVGLLSCSGCAEQTLEEAESRPPLLDDLYDEETVELPVRRTFGLAEEGVRQADGTTLGDPEALGQFLDDQGLLVESIEETAEAGEELLELQYADEEFTDRGVLYSLGRISGGYAALLASDYTADKLDASIHRTDGEKFGAFEIATADAERYLDGEITATAYARTVADTVKAAA